MTGSPRAILAYPTNRCGNVNPFGPRQGWQIGKSALFSDKARSLRRTGGRRVVLLDEAATWTGVGALALSALLLALGIVLFARWRRLRPARSPRSAPRASAPKVS